MEIEDGKQWMTTRARRAEEGTGASAANAMPGMTIFLFVKERPVLAASGCRKK